MCDQDSVVVEVQKLLNSGLEGEIDILDNDGACLEIAFSTNNYKLMKLLISYYEQHVLDKAIVDSETGLCSELKRLTDKIDYIVQDEVISPQMRKLLQHYMNDQLTDDYDIELSETSSISDESDQTYQETKYEVNEDNLDKKSDLDCLGQDLVSYP